MVDEEGLTTPQLVEMYYAQAKRLSNPWHSQIKKRRKLYDMDHYTQAARQGEERYNDPTYTNIVDLAVGIILANDLTFRVYGWTPSSQEQKDSDKVEKLLAGLLQANSERSETYLPYDVLLNFVRDGMAVAYTVWDDEIAGRAKVSVTVPDPNPDSPRTQQLDGFSEPPLRIQAIDPLKIYLIPGGPNRWLYVIRAERKTVLDIELTYGVTVKRYAHETRQRKEAIEADLLDFWRMAEGVDGQRVIQHAITFEGEVIQELAVEDGYDDLPFTVGFFKPVDRETPKKWSHSIIDPLESTVEFLEKAFNRRQFQITRYSALPLTVYVQPGRDVEVDPALGSVIKMAPDEKVGFPEWAGNPPDVDRQMEFLRARSQQSGFSDVMFGSSSQMSGYGISQLGDQNRIRLEQPVQHLQLFWQRVAKKALHICEHFSAGRVMRVYGQMRGREFYDQVLTEGLSDYQVQVIVKPEFPNDRVRNHALASQVRGFLSEDTIMQRYLDIEQPGDEREKRLIEQMENHPLMIQRSIVRQLRLAAEGGDMDAAIVLEQMMAQGQPGGSQQQPNPPNPEQPLGTASPTGQPTPQEQGGVPYGQEQLPFQQSPDLLGGFRESNSTLRI